MANKRTSLAPPSDDELASAEIIDMQKKRDRLDLIEQEQETARLARAGDPEAKESLRVLNSVLSSTPAGPAGEDDEPTPEAPKPPVAAKSRVVKSSKTTRKAAASKPPPEVQEKDPEELESRAYKLMDMAYQKWNKGAKSNLAKANRELAMDLGKDTAVYLKAQIIRLGDLHDVINKLTAVKPGKEETEDAADFDEEMESMRKALRANTDGD